MKTFFRKLYWLFSTQLGLDPRRAARSLSALPGYVSGWLKFRKNYHGKLKLWPCLQDRHEAGGSTNEYFWQDLYIARKIFAACPQKHVDIGSRVDGFVAHVASFREIEVFDIRPVSAKIPGVIFRQADLMNPPQDLLDHCDSLSCLHALEHFGLGRYGDPIDPAGPETGLRNMVRMLRPGGRLYLAVPIGEARVEFNAHRIFDPVALAEFARTLGLELHEFAWVGHEQILHIADNPEQDLPTLARQAYALGIFTFSKAVNR